MKKIGMRSNKISFDSIICLLGLIFVIFVNEIEGQSCASEITKDVTDGRVLDNGTVVFGGVSYQPDIVFDRNISGEIRKLGCSCNKCLPKCCPTGYGYNYYMNRTKVCISMEEEDIIMNYGLNLTLTNSSKSLVSMNDLGFGLVFGKPCSAMFKEYEKWHIQEDGQLYVELPFNIPSWSLYPPDKYCIDTFINGEGSEMVTKLDALICFSDESQEEETAYTVSSTCMLISCVFILATVAIYTWLPELQNLHGRVLVAYLLCLFVGFIFMSTMQILLKFNNINEDTCVVLTFIIYFSLLSAFFWLNVMCFDIWWTFSGKRGISETSLNARFGAYAAYAFSVPCALTVILAALEFSDLPPHLLLPQIRHQGCFLYGRSKLLYFYGPIVVLCVANMVFFLLTAIKINNIKKQTSVLKSKESAMHDQHRNDKQRLTLYIKLFAVMGISWILEVISAIYPEADSFWRYTDAYNVLIGVIIFVIFVCKRKIFRLVKKRYRQVRGISNVSRTQTASSKTTSYRDEYPMSSVKTSI